MCMKRLSLLIFLLVVITGVYAQKISGVVTNADTGEPVPFATIAVKGHTVGTNTDSDGKFTIEVPAGAKVIVASYVGMVTKEVIVGNSSFLNIQMNPVDQALDEIVVTAMGIKKEKKALGYSVQDINSEELLKNKNTNVINSLNGKIAGVNITQSGGAAGAGSNIVIRGGTSLERDNQPLFVVDGIIYDNGTNVGGNSAFDGALRTATTFSNRVMDINPEDVESMSVLKGPTAAALYGSRAAAGVIIITTKKGQEGAVNVSLSSRLSLNWVNRYPEQQNKYKRGTYNTAGVFDDYTTQSWGDAFGEGETMYNNIEDFFDTAVTWDNNLSISGGSKNGSFYLSAANTDQGSIIPKTGLKRNAFRFNGEQKYGGLVVSTNMAYSVTNNDKTFTSTGLYGSGGIGAMQSVYTYARSEDMTHYLNDDGTRWRMFPSQAIADDVDNPYWIINKDKLKDKTTRFTGAINADYKVADWFKIMYKGGTDRYTTNSSTLLYPGSGVIVKYQNGMMSESDYTYEALSSNLMLSFKHQISDFDLNLLVGHNVEDTKYKVSRRMGYDFEVDNLFSFGNILDANKRFQDNLSRKRLVGVYGEFRPSYKNFLYLGVTVRNDWSSTLLESQDPARGGKSYIYPSVDGSFLFTELLPKSDLLSFGKIRASWAKVGKDTEPYATNTYLWDPREYLGGAGLTNSWTRGNAGLVPEETRSTEFGTEMHFLKGRLSFDYAYYRNESKNQIITPRMSQTTGYILVKTNGGLIVNKGMELSISGIPVETKDFTWTTTLNLSGNRGKVKNLPEGLSILYVTDVQVGTAKAASFGGGNFMAISGSKWSRDDAGNVILDAKTGMPTSDKLETYEIGNREPKLIGGLNNSLQYKNWNLSFLLDFRIGGDIYNGTDYTMTNAGMSKRSQDRESITINGVVQSGSEYVAKTYVFDADKFYNINDYSQVVSSTEAGAISGKNIIQKYWQTYYPLEASNYMTKTNWLRLRSVSLSYDVPKSFLAKAKVIKALTVNMTGTNLLLLTNYKGMDPENSAAGSGVTGSGSAGIDLNGTPSTAGMTFGVNVTF